MASAGPSARPWAVTSTQESVDSARGPTGQLPPAAELPPFDPNDPAMIEQQYLFPLPMPKNQPPRDQTAEETAKIKVLGELQFFLATAPTKWNSPDPPMANITKFHLPNGEAVSCIFWSGLYHITGTDIVRALSYRFEAFGRPVRHTKKWEEGVFSDLRNLKPGTDACLEEPKSPLLEFLFRMGCIRTQKKQKVFYWFSVPHDRLFLDALERDLKREKAGQEPTTAVVGEPALSFIYDPRRSLFEQFAGSNPGLDDTWGHVDEDDEDSNDDEDESGNGSGNQTSRGNSDSDGRRSGTPRVARRLSQPATQLLTSRGLFEGSPSYKKRRPQFRSSLTPSRYGSVEVSLVRGLERSVSVDEPVGVEMPPHIHRVISGESYGRDSSVALNGDREDTPGSGTDDRNFPCRICHRAFKRLEHMKRHLRTHTNEKPYACPRCDRSFSRQDNLVQHAKTHGRYDERGVPIGTPGPDDEMEGAYSPASGQYDRFVSPHGQRWPSVLEEPSMGGHMYPPPYPLLANRSATVPPEWSTGGFILDNARGLSGGSGSGGGMNGFLDPRHHHHHHAHSIQPNMIPARRFRSATPYAPTTSSSLAQTVLTAPPQQEQWVDVDQGSPIMSVPQGLGLPMTAPPGMGQGFFWRGEMGPPGAQMFGHPPPSTPHTQIQMVGLYPQQYGQ